MKKMTEKQDMAFDKKNKIKENSPKDLKQDKKMVVSQKPMMPKFSKKSGGGSGSGY